MSIISSLKDKYRDILYTWCQQSDWFHRLLFLLKLLLRALWYLPLLAMIIIFTPVIICLLKGFCLIFRRYIKFGELSCLKIGEMIHRAELYLRRRQLSPTKEDKEIHIFLCKDKPANKQALNMIKRRMLVVNSRLVYTIFKMARMCYPKAGIWYEPLHYEGNAFKEFNSCPPQIGFTLKEERQGEKELAHIGVLPGYKFVCIHARDKAYHDRILNFQTRDYWSYHDHRDSDINNYLPAAEYLASKGMFVLRIGFAVEKPLNITNSKIIDYSSLYRSEFMDMYLLGHCKFFLGTNSGLTAVADSLGVPVAAANWIPIKYQMLCNHDLFIPKKLWSKAEKRFLTFREIINSGIDAWNRAQQYEQAGIEVIENTKEEILALAKEMDARIDNTWIETEEDKELQQRYRSLFPKGHYSYGFSSRIGAEFLRENRYLLE